MKMDHFNHKELRAVNTMLIEGRDAMDGRRLEAACVRLARSDARLMAAMLSGMVGGRKLPVGDLVMVAFRSLMLRRDLVGAATLLWSESYFTAEPWACRAIWAGMERDKYVSVLGAGGTGKSFTVGARYFLEWAADPDWTRVDLVSKNQQKIKKLFADFVGLHRAACVTLPGKVEAETIATDKLGGWGIFLNLIGAGDQSSSVLKGTHEKARKTAHPVFGFRTARYVMIDEAQDVPEGVFDDIPNVLLSAQPDDGTVASCGGRRMRQVMLTANPALPNSRYGEQCRPEMGWGALDDAESWRARLGAWCVRIDALKTENVMDGKAGREPRFSSKGLVTWTGVRETLTACDGNELHPQWWTYVRGMFPPEGALATLIPQHAAERVSVPLPVALLVPVETSTVLDADLDLAGK